MDQKILDRLEPIISAVEKERASAPKASAPFLRQSLIAPVPSVPEPRVPEPRASSVTADLDRLLGAKKPHVDSETGEIFSAPPAAPVKIPSGVDQDKHYKDQAEASKRAEEAGGEFFLKY